MLMSRFAVEEEYIGAEDRLLKQAYRRARVMLRSAFPGAPVLQLNTTTLAHSKECAVPRDKITCIGDKHHKLRPST